MAGAGGMRAWEWQVTAAAKNKGVRRPPTELPQGESEAQVAFVENLRGPRAWYLTSAATDPRRPQLPWTDGVLVILAVSQCPPNAVAPEWKPAMESLASQTEEQHLSMERFQAIVGQAPKKDIVDESAEIVDFIPKFEAFAHPCCGFYCDFYRVSWKGTQVLECENSEPWDIQCTWEPQECLEANAMQMFKARENWVKRCRDKRLLLSTLTENPALPDLVTQVSCALLKPPAGTPPMAMPEDIRWPAPTHITAQQAQAALASFREMVGSGRLQVRDLSSLSWKPHQSRSDARVQYWANSKEGSVMQGDHAMPAALLVLPSWEKRPVPPETDIPISELRSRSRSPRSKRALFRTRKCIGKGSFGEVKEVEELESGLTMAVKSVGPNTGALGFQACQEALKEAKLLVKLRHPNIVGCRNIFWQDNRLHLALELVPMTLERFMMDSHPAASDVPMWIRQLFSALNACHKVGVVHCDVKPPNILILPQASRLKLADFGSAITTGRARKEYYCSRWYRPPEVICGEQIARPQQDVWSAGTIFAELYMHMPLFPGLGLAQQFVHIIAVLGTPNDAEMKALLGLEPQDPRTFPWNPPVRALRWNDVLANKASPQAVGLITSCLTYNPNLRMSAEAMTTALEAKSS